MTNEATQVYRSERDGFIRAVDAAIAISQLIGVQQADMRRGWASWLFMRLCVTGRSVERLLSDEPVRPGEPAYLDHGSVAALARNLLDNATVLLYFGDADLSDDDWWARKHVADIHDCVSRGEFFTLLGDLQESNKFSDILSILQDKFREDVYFNNIDRKRQKHLLDGKDMYIGGRSQAALALGFGLNGSKAVYKYLSMQTHTMPMSFHRTIDSNLYNGKNLKEMAVSGYAIAHAREAIRVCCVRMLSLFPEAGAELSKEILDFLIDKKDEPAV